MISGIGNFGVQRSAVILCLLIMIVGTAVRFTSLDGKVFGNDEATTSVHVSGKTIAQYAATMFDGRQRTAQEVLAFQQPDPGHRLADVVRSLAVEDPQHPPLYYLIEREWELHAGSSIGMRRVIAAAFGSIAIVTAVWLGFELDSLLAGLVAGAMVAASPFAIAYSQVDREYSLWLALTFAASALLVRASRRESLAVWSAYVAVSVAALYTDALYVLVVAAHVLAICIARPHTRRTLSYFAGAIAIIVTAYGPWISALISGYAHGSVTNNAYLSAGLSWKPFVLKWIFNIGTLFYDADYAYPRSAVLVIPGFIALVAAYALCVGRFRVNRQISVIFTLTGVTLVALVFPDLVFHEQRSTASRYMLPLWVACYMALGVGLAISIRAQQLQKRLAALGFVILTALTGFGSFAVSTRHDTWWTDGSTASINAIARAINSVKGAVVIYHSTWGPGSKGPEVWDFSVVMVADLVAPTTSFIQYGRDALISVPSSETSLLLDPSDAVIDALRAQGARPRKIAGGAAAAVSGDIETLRQSVARERQRRGAASLSPSSTLWTIQCNGVSSSSECREVAKPN